MKVYDCFLLLDELDLLEIRLEILSNVVDKFIIIESNYAFNGQSKDYNYEINQSRFAKYQDKIIYKKLDLTPINGIEYMMPWDKKLYSRQNFDDLLVGCDPEDLIFLSNIDEIWDPSKYLDGLENDPVAYFLNKKYYYYLNLIKPDYYTQGTRRVQYINYPGAVNLKNSIGWKINAGWNFSLLGDASHIKYMIDSKSYMLPNQYEVFSLQEIQLAIDNKYQIDDNSINLNIANIDSLPLNLSKYMHYIL